MSSERRRNWKNQVLVSFARDKANLSLMEMDVLPSQRRYVTKALASVEPEVYYRTPFIISNAENCFQFRNGKRATNSSLPLSDGMHELSGIIRDLGITSCSPKDHPQKLDLVIYSFWSKPLSLLIAKARDMFAGNFHQVRVSRVGQEGEELVCRVSIKGEG